MKLKNQILKIIFFTLENLVKTITKEVGSLMMRTVDELGIKKEFIRTLLTLKFTCWGDEVKEKLKTFCSLDENQQLLESLTKEDINSFLEEQKKAESDGYLIEVFLPKDPKASDQDYQKAILAAAYYPKELERPTRYVRAISHSYVHKQLAYAAYYGYAEAVRMLHGIDSNEAPISQKYDDYVCQKSFNPPDKQIETGLFFDNQQDLINSIADDGAKYLSQNMSWKKLKSLNLIHNKIGKEGAKYLNENMSGVNLETLYPRENSIVYEGARALSQIFYMPSLSCGTVTELIVR